MKNKTGMGGGELTLPLEREHEKERIIALAGNPNVGKSTFFNAMTGLNQHTGNWPGKTVASATGRCSHGGNDYLLVDLPGTYSLISRSREEEIARDFLLFGGADAVIVVCDATCLERNLNLLLQAMEITPRVLVCVNLMDEAAKKHIAVDLAELESRLRVPVVGLSARSGKGLNRVMDRLEEVLKIQQLPTPPVTYGAAIEEAVQILTPMATRLKTGVDTRWLCLRMLENPEQAKALLRHCRAGEKEDSALLAAAQNLREEKGLTCDEVQDILAAHTVMTAEYIAGFVVRSTSDSNRFDRRLDRVLTNKFTGIPIMILLLCGVLWLTITGANYPSQLLATGLFWVQDRLTDLFALFHAPAWLHGILVLGVYRVLAWVVSVMLPPMAIFFPLFTLLEDFGYLPRIAFNLDHCFQKAHACGRQSLTMCMGLGCNAAGVVGCRIIDSPRERLIAVMTNQFMPCNGRFPMLIALISMFFAGTAGGVLGSFQAAVLLAALIVLGVVLTFLMSNLLSRTALKGEASSFTLELPPYRRPQIGRVIVRSLFDRTLFVLKRAVAVAAPAGAIIWLAANLMVGDVSLLKYLSDWLDPFARLLGLDGIILIAFILGFPANEIVVPIMMMGYLATGSLMEYESLNQLKTLFVDNGWTWCTAVSCMLFCLAHWPCSTTMITIKKETGSFKWTALSFLIPTLCGLILCFLFHSAVQLLGIA